MPERVVLLELLGKVRMEELDEVFGEGRLARGGYSGPGGVSGGRPVEGILALVGEGRSLLVGKRSLGLGGMAELGWERTGLGRTDVSMKGEDDEGSVAGRSSERVRREERGSWEVSWC
eukprot:scaffold1636_cov165-Ochromonas_danica.AAC.6